MTNQKLSKIIKRDGSQVKFDQAKIVRAINKSVAETGEFEQKESKRLAGIVVTLIEKTNGKHVPSVEEVQDVVEQVLMAGGYYQTAKAYILYRSKRAELRAAEQVIGVEDDLGLSLNQLRVIERRYLLHDEDGKAVETPKEWLTRVAKTLAAVEKKKEQTKWEEEFFQVMANFEFLPAGRTLNNAGTKQNQLANCFVLPVEDSMEGIFEAVKQTALVHQTGGGTGFNFSKLRPSGDVVSKAAGGFATGPVSFMKVFDVATRQVMQGGKKRGANMGILNIDHPDVFEFINCKTQEGEIANFNISLGVTDSFMKAVKKDGDYWLVNRRTGDKVQKVSARTLMDQIVALAWRTGDPGMIYLDAINRNNPLLEAVGSIEATNPCGEQPLHPFDACNLGSINLAAFVNSDKKQVTSNKKKVVEERVDWERLGEVVRISVRMLDDVIDAGKYPLPEITKTVKRNRRIGLGIMGWADMLFQLGIPYDSEEGVELAERVMKFVQQESWLASEELAKEKGVFPAWEESAFAKGWDPLTQSYKKQETSNKKIWRVRNVAITTIAPTGTISMAADTSSGIEPVFALSFVKNVVSEEGLTYVNSHFEKALKVKSMEQNELQVILREVARHGGARGVDGVPKKLQRVFATAHDIAWEWHVRMQAAFQKYTDNAVSKTINFPANAGMEEVRGAYLMAWELGCKGITVYRDSSKEYQVLASQQSTNNNQQTTNNSKYLIQSKIKTRTLKERMEQDPDEVKLKDEEACPDCQAKLAFEEGCVSCYGCGWSKCSL